MAHDTNGRREDIYGEPVTYTSFDLPRTVGERSYLYDVFKKLTFETRPEGELTHVSDMLDVREVLGRSSFVYHVFAEGREIAQVQDREGEARETLFLHGDALESTVAVTRGDGSLARETSYEPFGRPFGDLPDPLSGVAAGFWGQPHEKDLATGSSHNVARSKQMLAHLERIGLHDTAATRQYLTEHLTGVLNNLANIARVQANGRVVRESQLMGPRGGVKFETVWEGERLITGNIFGGP